MADTLYASFADPAQAEQAAGALLDHGARAEDISLVTGGQQNNRDYEGNAYSGQTTTGGTTTGAGYTGTTTGNEYSGDYAADQGNDVGNAADSVGDRLQAGGNRLRAVGNDIVGDDTDAAKYHQRADQHDREAENQWGNATDTGRTERGNDDPYLVDPNVPAGTGATVGPGGYGVRPGHTDTSDVNRVNLGDNDTNRDDNDLSAKSGISTTTPEDAGAGAVKGAGIGLGVGALAAIASLFIPGVGLVTGGGALAAAIGAAAATTGAGAVAGAVTGYLKDQGVDADTAERYNQTISGGGTVLAVHLPSGDLDHARAAEIVHKYGGTDTNTYGSGQGYSAA